MGEILYNRIDFKLDNLLMDIESGKLGLPDIQRPFVWKNIKVRELFDSMLLGYPIGYLMLWDSPDDGGKTKQIGTDSHAYRDAKQLIIDGQQRLTSLYAVMYGKEVIDEHFNKKTITIAFNPMTRKFEVSTAPLRKSPEWIGDISTLFLEKKTLTYTNRFIAALRESYEKNGKEFTDEDEETVANNIQDLLSLKNYMIPTLAITDQAGEEDVAEIFKRVNSGGATLNENDFILTLISVHDEAERRKIEKFCYEATIPVKSGSSYNHIFKPKPAHLIRTVMAFGFKRARLRYAYMVLRGKDMDTGVYSSELRDQKFKELENNLEKVLDLNNWHEFINCVISAGYLTDTMIPSDNALVYTYVMYLIGKYDFKTDAPTLRRAISRWFYMASVTYYYTGSFEGKVQQDLNNISELKNSEEFIAYIDRKIRDAFTDDYFGITLPVEFATTSVTGPSWNAFCAAQNILNSKALFSTMHIRDLFQPGASGSKSSVERHHLWPKAYLSTIGFKNDRDRNQIANYAYIEWKDNINISDTAPSEYWPIVIEGISENTLMEMMEATAIPEGWTEMTYPQFLEARRKLMADVVRKGYQRLPEN